MLDIISICITISYIFILLFIITGLFKHKVLPISSSIAMPMVSIVIAARNEEDCLPYIIDDLIKQEYPLEKLEVIIINDRSDDSTAEILNESNNNYLFIKVIHIKEKTKTMTPKKNALTLGIQEAKGDVILLTDADCRLNKLWVSSMVYSVINKDSISIGFSQISDINNSIFTQYQKVDFLSIIAANAGAAGWGRFWSGTGQNLGFLKEDFLSINGFEPVKNDISGDDMYLVQNISNIKNGYLHIDPNSFVKTNPMKNIKEFINQRTRWSSNAKKNFASLPDFFLFLSTIFLYNSFILFSLFFGGEWVLLVLIKFILDGLVIFLGGRLFNVRLKIKSYLIWSLLQPLYIPVIGILGIRGKFSWKP